MPRQKTGLATAQLADLARSHNIHVEDGNDRNAILKALKDANVEVPKDQDEDTHVGGDTSPDVREPGAEVETVPADEGERFDLVAEGSGGNSGEGGGPLQPIQIDAMTRAADSKASHPGLDYERVQAERDAAAKSKRASK